MQHLKETSKNTDKSQPKVTMKQAFKTIIWPRRNLVFIGLLLIVIRSLSGLILPWQSKVLLDDVVPNKDISQLYTLIAVVIGAITALFMGFLGLIQTDIKRVVAYSTLSQLGYMTVALGVSAYSIAMFHVMTHAFFKALLFLGAGSVIIGMHHNQDIRAMGGLRKYMPITWITFLIGSVALAGVPFFSGFYSKEHIIEAAAAAATAATVFGSYVLPDRPVLAAVGLVVVVTGLVLAGVTWTVRGAWALVGGVGVVLFAAVLVGIAGAGGRPGEVSAAAQVAVPVGPASAAGSTTASKGTSGIIRICAGTTCAAPASANSASSGAASDG